MQRIRLCSGLFISVVVLAGHSRAQDAARPGTLYEMTLPGGLRGALAAIDDRAAPDRSQFLLEFIRRTYNTPLNGKSDPRDAVLRSLLAHLDLASRQNAGPAASPETLPLPLSPAIWIDVVFGGRATSQSLVGAILRSRNAALLYHGLLSLDDGTRAWLETQPELIAEIASRRSAAFLVAAPGLRVAGGAVRVPGGELAEPVWQALVGRRANEPADFVRALLDQEDGRLAYFFGAMADLTPDQIRLVLSLESPDADVRAAAVRRVRAVFEHVIGSWKIDDRAFWRPLRDPALLAADLASDDHGRPVVPGTRRFWSAVMADADAGRGGENDPQAFAEGEPVEYAWLCEQIFLREPLEQRRRYELVLFASRVVKRITPDNARDAIEVVRAAGTYPALVGALERTGSVDLAAAASAARRAARLSAIGDEPRAVRALQQFQGMLALLTRAAMRGSLPAGSLSKLVSSLSAVDLSDRGDYEGRLVRWLGALADAQMREWTRKAPDGGSVIPDASREPYGNALLQNPADFVDQYVLRLLAGPAVVEPRFVEWEGTRYRLDLARAEGTRLARLLGEHPRPYLSSARALVAIADDLGEAGVTQERLRRAAGDLDRVAHAVAPGSDPSTSRSFDDVASTLRRVTRDADLRGAQSVAVALRVLADDLLARGLLELAYAAALGQPDRGAISLADVAVRHDFGLRAGGIGRITPWRRPVPDFRTERGWHVVGSILGLDVTLAEFSLTRVSAKAISRRPTLMSEDRRVLTEAVALVEPASLTDADRDAIVAAMKKGRARIAAIHTPAEAVEVADEIRLAPIRRTLLPWVVTHDVARVRVFLSPAELLWLGLGKTPVDPRFHAWGALAEPRLGCLCLQVFDRRPWEPLAGRWNSGLLASSFPDLNLRLAELLSELQMPAPLLGPVLASATFDFVNTATSRDQDDRRGLVEFVHGLRPEQVEEYLAMLTTDGPLVPVNNAPGPAEAGAVSGVPR